MYVLVVSNVICIDLRFTHLVLTSIFVLAEFIIFHTIYEQPNYLSVKKYRYIILQSNFHSPNRLETEIMSDYSSELCKSPFKPKICVRLFHCIW